MRLKVLVSVIVVICCGLAVRYLASRSQERKGQPAEAKVKVLVAKQKISPWVPIKEPEKFFVEKEVPASAAPKKALKSFEEAKDQKLCKVVNEGSIVTTDDLLNKDQASLAHLMKAGQRAIALKLNAESLDVGSVRPGDRVDVFSDGPEPILRDVEVVGVDTKAVRDPESQAMIGLTVTLAATPEEAQGLALAASMGNFRLVPRRAGEYSPLLMRKVPDLGRPVTDGIGDTEDKQVVPVPWTLPPLPAVPEAKAGESPPKPKVTIRNGKIFICDEDGSFEGGRSQNADDPDGTRGAGRNNGRIK